VNGEQRLYIVSNVTRVHYKDISPVMPTTDDRLTLFTCAEGTYDASINNYTERDVVTATRAG
jgi:sortase (surface protein transpeptidase)